MTRARSSTHAPHTTAKVTYTGPADQVVVVDRAVVQSQILAALFAGPLMKWQLRAALHVPEEIIYRELLTLRDRGQVKVVGRALDKRAWALVNWRQAPIVPDTQTITIAKPISQAAPPKESWWTRSDLVEDRKAFQRRAVSGAETSLRYR